MSEIQEQTKSGLLDIWWESMPGNDSAWGDYTFGNSGTGDEPEWTHADCCAEEGDVIIAERFRLVDGVLVYERRERTI